MMHDYCHAGPPPTPSEVQPPPPPSQAAPVQKAAPQLTGENSKQPRLNDLELLLVLKYVCQKCNSVMGHLLPQLLLPYGFDCFAGTFTIPQATTGYKPSRTAISEAQKLAKYAASSLGFEDSDTAIQQLTDALTMLTQSGTGSVSRQR